MAASLLLLLDDLATVLDDVAVLAKVAARKTAGVLGDDLALNAQQVSGVAAARELPVVGAVALGSLRNKAILVPLALVLSAWAPWLITPLLMAGGLYLCVEGAEKLLHAWTRWRSGPAAADAAHEAELAAALADPAVDWLALEREKVRGAIRTDFILSTEIIVIALGVVQNSAWPVRVGALIGVAVAMTLGVYGLVAAIVKLDDLGLWLLRRGWLRPLGMALVRAAPWLMRSLTVLGTLAMFLVGGGIVLHGWHAAAQLLAGWGGGAWGQTVLTVLAGVALGLLALPIWGGLTRLTQKVFRKKP